MSSLTRDQAMWGAIALSMFEQHDRPRTIQPYQRATLKSLAPSGPTPKRAKVKAARKQRRKTK